MSCKNDKKIEFKEVIDPRGPGSVDSLEQMRDMEGGQPNIIDYSNQEPLLFGLGEDSSHEYPGKIVVNNEPKRALEELDFEVKKKTIPGPAATGIGATGHNTTQPTLPTGGVEIDHNAHGMNFNDKVRWNESKIEFNEAFVEQDHPRAATGSSTGGQFVSKDGDDLESGMQLKYKTTIQGQEIDVNLRQKKTWEKHTSQEQRNDPDFNTRYSDDLKTQGQEEKPAEPKPKPSAFVDVTPESPIEKPTIEAPGPTRDLYKNLPADTEKPGEGRKLRKEKFAAYEEDNGKLYELRDTIKIQKGQIQYQNDQIAEREGEEPSQRTENRRENIKALEESIKEKTIQIDDIESKLLKDGKLEYEEIQHHLHNRQFYVDDLTRRKSGSMAYYKAQGQIFAHDRVIDDYRTGKTTGHFPGTEMEKHKINVKAAREDELKTAQKARAEKNKVKFAKMDTENTAAADRLTAKGFDINREKGSFATPPDEEKFGFPNPENRPMPDVDTLKDHREYLAQYKSAIENQVDIRTLRVNNDEMKSGFSSDYDRKELKEAKWKQENFVDDHKMIGVVMYNDGDKVQAKIYEKQFNKAPQLAQMVVKTISIYKGKGPTGVLTGPGRGFTTLGAWNKTGQVKLFYASKKSRDKLEKMGFTKPDFDLTGDHEFAHAAWYGAKDYIDSTGDEVPLALARDKFTEVVKEAYSNTDFKIHPYTDSYRGGGFMRGPDILENEVHSKLREFEITGELTKLEKSAKQSIDMAKSLGAKGEPTTSIGKNFQRYDKIIKAYKNLRKEMYAI